MILNISVKGRPAPQGSHSLGGAGQFLDASPYLRSWRAAVRIGAFRAYKLAGIAPAALPVFGPGVPVIVQSMIFYVDDDQCRTAGTEAPIGKPDIDKLVRATLDALGGARPWKDTAKLFADDSQVTEIRDLRKMRPGNASTGAYIVVSDGRD